MPFDFATLALGLGAVLRLDHRAGARIAPARGEPELPGLKPRDVLPLSRRRDAIDVVPVPSRSQPALATPLTPMVAARRFVTWMQEMGFTGERPWNGPRRDSKGRTEGLWDYYLWHCDDERLTPIPDNMLGAALGELAAKRRSMITKRQVRLNTKDASGKRVLYRPTYYTIAEPEEPAAAAPKPRKRRR